MEFVQTQQILISKEMMSTRIVSRTLQYFAPVMAAFFLLSSCSSSMNASSVNKFSAEEVKEDLHVFETTYKEAHPSLYWYTSRDSVNGFFDLATRSVKDSMTEPEIYRLIAYTLSPIHCGHSSVKYSKRTSQRNQPDLRPRVPFELRYFQDTALVTLNYRRADSVIQFGTEIKTINRVPVTEIRDSLFKYMSSDGFNTTVKYSRLNGSFSSYHRLVYGLYDKYEIGYINKEGVLSTVVLPLYDPLKDSNRRTIRSLLPPPVPADPLDRYRKLVIDSSTHTAVMIVNTFENKGKLVRFFKRSFRDIRKEKISSLVIDLRNNGGGNLSRSALLGKFIANKSFKICDTAFAVKRSGFTYSNRIRNKFFYWLMMNFLTHKRKDGKYHFGYLEKHVYHPRKTNHYDKDVYVLTAGATFSASTLFINHVKGQPNVKIIGDETGGGYYGSSAINIPDIILPNSKIRVRLPLYRLVMDKDRPKTGHGFYPDYNVPVTTESLKRRVDAKLEFTKKLIAMKKRSSGGN